MTEPVFLKPIKDYSLLKTSVLIRLISMADNIGITFSEKINNNTVVSVALQSTVVPSITYEIIHLKDISEVYIYVCTVDTEQKITKRNFCCYANGDILVWGTWMIELLETLPNLYEKIRADYYTKLINKRIAEGLLPRFEEKWNAKEIATFNRDFNNSGLVRREVLEEHYAAYKLFV